MYTKVQGLVLRVAEYKEQDAILTLLTSEYGRLSVKARGLRRRNSPLIASCQLLTLCEFTLFEYRGFYTINEAHPKELFQGLRRDLFKLSLGTYFANVAEVISQEDVQNPELLALVLNCLYALSDLQHSQSKIKAAFELRSACLAGYTPDLYNCPHCGNSSPDRFNITAGVVECSGCGNQSSADLRMPIGPGILDALRYICSCDPKRLLSFSLPEKTTEQLAQVTEVYFVAQLERGFSTLDFYKTLLLT